MLAWMESSKRNREIAAYIIAAVDGLPFGRRALKRPFLLWLQERLLRSFLLEGSNSHRNVAAAAIIFVV